MEKHKVIPENIKGIRNQQKDFEKLYFSAMVSNVNKALSVRKINLDVLLICSTQPWEKYVLSGAGMGAKFFIC